jgi:alpha-beta hydrolase superfamily lysophospholipase
MTILQASDGVPLRVRRWPLPAVPRGTVLIVHGLGEHMGRYEHVAGQLTEQGWAVVGFDQRGHGQSGGPRGGVPTADALLADLATVLDTLLPSAPRPLVLLGHSMGGLLVGRFVAEGLAPAPAAWYRPVDALVMSSPAIDPGMNVIQRGLLAVLGPLAPDLALGNGLRPEWISRDASVVVAYRDDLRVHDRITPRLVRFIVDGGRAVLAAAPAWRVPTLLVYAGADRCVAPAGSAAFAAAAPPAVVQSRCFDGLYHEIFNEPERQVVLGLLTEWLAHLAWHPA